MSGREDQAPVFKAGSPNDSKAQLGLELNALLFQGKNKKKKYCRVTNTQKQFGSFLIKFKLLLLP